MLRKDSPTRSSNFAKLVVPTIGAVIHGLEICHAKATWAMLIPRFSAIAAMLYQQNYYS